MDEKKMDIDELAGEYFLSYANEVIKQRAIPSVDGLKVVHRRILHIMKDMKLSSDKPTRKSAAIVGTVLSRSHPHGDSSVYDALIRLSQPWKLRYPLVEIQGNNGSIQGDSAASSRYTETRLSSIGELVLGDTVAASMPTEWNYSNEEQLPILLPSEFPNLLCNPSLGIAVSMSSTTLPHNLNEVCDAITEYINTGDVDIMKHIKGPDFPTGGIVVNADDLPEIYAKGRGGVRLRSRYTLKVVNGKTHIIITEIPYLVDFESQIYNKIKALVLEDGVTEIENIQNNMGKDGFEVRIICKRNANVPAIIEMLCKKTGFEKVISMNNTILVNGVPRELSYKDMLKHWVDFRHKALYNIASDIKSKCEARVHIIDGLLIAIADIDNVIAIIRSCDSRAAAKVALIAKYNFSDPQVTAILDMRLSRLTNLETVDLISEKGELAATIETQNSIITNKDKARDKQLLAQIKSIKSKFGDSRKTQITQEKVAKA